MPEDDVKTLNSFMTDVQTTKGLQVSKFRQIIEDCILEIKSFSQRDDDIKTVLENINFVMMYIKKHVNQFIITNDSLRIMYGSNRKIFNSQKDTFRSILHSEHSAMSSMMEEFEKRVNDVLDENQSVSRSSKNDALRELKNILQNFSKSNSKVEKSIN